jgi:uncharacterized protein (TIGR03083 family)
MADDLDRLEALRTSAGRLRGLVEGLEPAQLEQRAYPTEWTIADVLSHLGSGAVIFRDRLDASVSGRDVRDDFAPSVWDEWNAKAPADQASDALTADRALLDAFDAMTADERAAFHQVFGPFELGLAATIGLRLNEHALHTWDIEVVLDPTATMPASSVDRVIDTVEVIAGFAGKPTDVARRIHVHTTEPARDFAITLGEAVSFATVDGGGTPDLVLPAEALIRLIYGRLDPDHTPPIADDTGALDDLRASFRGL